MKKTFFILILLSFFSCSQDGGKTYNFFVSGDVVNVPENTSVVLFKRDANNTYIVDSVAVKGGGFLLKGMAKELTFYGLKFSNNDYFIYLLLDSSDNVNLVADFNELQRYKVENSMVSEQVQLLENKLFETNLGILEAIEAGAEFSDILSTQRNFSQDFVSRFDTSLAVIIAFSQKFITGEVVLPIDSFFDLYKEAQSKLVDKYASVGHFRQFSLFIRNYEGAVKKREQFDSQVLRPVNLVDFEAKTLSGDSFKLSDLKGNWILLDFWATWVSSGYENNILMKKISRELPEVRIVQFSIDLSEEELLDTLLNYDFKHILINDTKGWGSKVLDNYAITRLPAFVLINPVGEIVFFGSDVKQAQMKVFELVK